MDTLRDFILINNKVSIDSIWLRSHYKASKHTLELTNIKNLETECWNNLWVTMNLAPEDWTRPHATGMVTPTDTMQKVPVKRFRYFPIYLLLQAFILSVPGRIWKYAEGQCCERKVLSPDLQNKEWKQRKSILLKRIRFAQRFMKWYGFKFYYCLVLQMILDTISIFILEEMIIGVTAYPLYKFGILAWNGKGSLEMIVTPQIVRCEMFAVGVGGSIFDHGPACFLAYSELYGYAYIVIWVLLHLLLTASFLDLLMATLEILCPSLRVWRLRLGHAELDKKTIQLALARHDYGYYLLLKNLLNELDMIESYELFMALGDGWMEECLIK